MIVSESDRRAFAHHVMVDEQHRLVFFTIPKVACTEWIRVFMRLRGVPDWRKHPHHREDRPFLSRYSAEECTEILTSPEWFRAAFFRDPVERLLSAFLDKLVYQHSYVTRLFDERGGDLSFDAFLSFVLDPNTDASRAEGLHEGTDPHWRAQSSVGNVGKFVANLDFAGRFDHLHEDAKALLRKRGLWEAFGATGWGPRGDAALFEVNDAFHITNARHLAPSYFSPELLARVRRAYRADYELFEQLNLTDLSAASAG